MKIRRTGKISKLVYVTSQPGVVEERQGYGIRQLHQLYEGNQIAYEMHLRSLRAPPVTSTEISACMKIRQE